jgi:GT2 family glycosyltransferase
MMAIPSVDVVVLTWNDGDLLQEAVSSVLASDGVDARVVVVDNASDEVVRLASNPRVRLLRNETNLGVARGRNQGAEVGDSPFVAFLDSDAVLLPDTLAALASPMLRDDLVGVTVPVFVDQHPTASAGRAPTLRVKAARAFGRRSDYEALDPPTGETWSVDFGIGACQLIRRATFEQVRGLDESIHFGPEDLDFCLRVKDLGQSVVQVGSARCIHPPRRRFRAPLTRRGLKHGRAVLRYYWRRSRLT